MSLNKIKLVVELRIRLEVEFEAVFVVKFEAELNAVLVSHSVKK